MSNSTKTPLRWGCGREPSRSLGRERAHTEIAQAQAAGIARAIALVDEAVVVLDDVGCYTSADDLRRAGDALRTLHGRVGAKCPRCGSLRPHHEDDCDDPEADRA